MIVSDICGLTSVMNNFQHRDCRRRRRLWQRKRICFCKMPPGVYHQNRVRLPIHLPNYLQKIVNLMQVMVPSVSLLNFCELCTWIDFSLGSLYTYRIFVYVVENFSFKMEDAPCMSIYSDEFCTVNQFIQF